MRQRLQLQNPQRQRRRQRDGRDAANIFIPGTKRKITVPIEEYPVTALLPYLDAPRLFNPLPVPDQFDIWFRYENEKAAALGAKYNLKEFATGSVDLWAMARVLAKMAHAHTVSQLGLDGFVPLLPNYIIGENDGARYFYVGGSTAPQLIATAGLHEIDIEAPTVEQWDLIVVRLRLFVQFGGPLYRVASGYRLKPAKPLELLLAEANAPHSPSGMPIQYRASPPIPPGLWNPTAPSVRGVLAQPPARHYRVKIDPRGLASGQPVPRFWRQT